MDSSRRPPVIHTQAGKASSAGGEEESLTEQAAAENIRPTSGKVSVTPVPTRPATGKPAQKKVAAVTSITASKPKAAKVNKASTQGTVLAFPEPVHKRRRRRVWLTLAGIAVVLGLVMSIALFSPVLAVKSVRFEGQKLVSEKTLQDAVESLKGRPLPQVTQSEVSALLLEVPQIKSSRVEAVPPSTLLIHLVERIPVALLKNGSEYLLVDQDGVQLGTTKDPAGAALPLIDGGKAAIGKDTFRAITAVLATLPKSVLSTLASASAKSPDAVELQMLDGKIVVWGNASDMELKAQVLEALLAAPAPTPEEGKEAPAAVKVYDVSAPRHPVTR